MDARIWARWAAGTILVVVLAACSAAPQHTPPPLTSGTPAPGALAPTIKPLPTRIVIPSIGVDEHEFIAVGLDQNHELITPTLQQPKTVAWYSASPSPGDNPECVYDSGCVQPAVLDAHINADGVQGAFAKLAQVKAGAKIAVTRTDGKTAHFTATKTMIFDKAKFPTRDVYGTPGLTLITCGPGDLVHTAEGGNYLQQTVVLARLDSITP